MGGKASDVALSLFGFIVLARLPGLWGSNCPTTHLIGNSSPKSALPRPDSLFLETSRRFATVPTSTETLLTP
jgi:hypothetical protein